jgi:PAS domain S-box-containing protein
LFQKPPFCIHPLIRYFGSTEQLLHTQMVPMKLELQVQDSVRRAINERSRYNTEFRLLHPNGGWVLEKGQIIYDEAGQPQRIIGVSLDITQRKWIEEGLRESEATLRSIYDNAPLLMGLVEPGEDDIRHLYNNPATHRFYGLQATESTTGRWASQLGMPRTTILKWLSHFRTSEANNQAVHFEELHDTPRGSRWLAATVSAIGPDYAGRTRFCCVAKDITERKQTEVALRESDDSGCSPNSAK